MDLFIAHFARPSLQHFEVVVARSPGRPPVRVTPIFSSALAYQGSSSSLVIGQSSRLASLMPPYSEAIRNSCSSKRNEAPAQCTVEPPTDFTIQAGRFGKSRATRQEPEVVRMSFQASCSKLAHSSLIKSKVSCRAPASRMTTLIPFWAGSLPRYHRPPGADDHYEPVVVLIELSHSFSSLSNLREPVDVAKSALDIATLFCG